MITVQTTIKAPIEKVWECWNKPEHISNWAFAADEWEADAKENDLRVGGRFSTIMAAKDGSASFEFGGEYTLIKEYQQIEYIMDDGRKVQITFKPSSDSVEIIESFDPETQNEPEFQKQGWQAILNNFKKYTESQ
ncbi:SRPBCC domain-containing protein [Candidatus Peregrinibacteria bacterium]|nr:SRPBCC domain-containing protein [Candidatus Peregrinibacteria bacterium]